MSIDQYSRHNNDVESGLEPQHETDHEADGEWPKKIRSLSTDDLDRLTIDKAGRFYWDGQLVNYGFAKPDGQLISARELSSLASPHQEATSQETLSQETTDRDIAMADSLSPKQTDATLDAIAEALAAATPAANDSSPVVVTPPVASSSIASSPYVSAAALAPTETNSVAAKSVVPAAVAATSVALAATAPQIVTATPMSPAGPNAEIVLSMPDEPRRFRLSFFQSIGALLLVLSVTVAAISVAASNLTVAHDYACKTGLVAAFCPKPPPAPARPPRGIID